MQISEENEFILNANQHNQTIEGKNKVRLFFALWPKETTRKALHNLASQYASPCKARKVDADALHLTLLFLGSIDRAHLPKIVKAASNVSSLPFKFTLNKFSCWQKNKIACATARDGSPALNHLVATLKQAFAKTSFVFENNAFIAHVTLLRQIENVIASQTITPINWKADSFVLVESTMTDQGSRYQILQEWPLLSIK